MSRVPPPTPAGLPSRPGDALRLVAVLLEAQVEDFGAGRRRPHRGVGVEADEEVGLVVVGERRALVEFDGSVGVARQDHPHAEAGLERRLQPARDAQRHVLLERAARAVRAVFRRRRDPHRRRWCGCRLTGRDRGAAGATPARPEVLPLAWLGPAAAGGAAVVSVMTSTMIRPVPRSPGKSDVRNDPNRGPRSRIRLAPSTRQVLNQVRRGDGRQRGIERLGLELDHQPRALLRDRVRCLRRDVERQARERAQGFDAAGDPGDADAADEDQARGFPQLDRNTKRGPQRSRDEVDRHEPRPAVACRRRRQRDQPAADRRQALPRGQHDRSACAQSPSARRPDCLRGRSARRASSGRRARTSPGY